MAIAAATLIVYAATAVLTNSKHNSSVTVAIEALAVVIEVIYLFRYFNATFARY